MCIIFIVVVDCNSTTAFNGAVTTPIIINADTNAVEVKAKKPKGKQCLIMIGSLLERVPWGHDTLEILKF